MDNIIFDKEILEDIKNRLVKIYNPVSIYLFGSYAWGVPDKNSDFDLFIIINDSILSMADRIRLGLYGLSDLKKPLDILVYTQEEVNSRKNHPSTLANKVLKKGIKLYETA